MKNRCHITYCWFVKLGIVLFTQDDSAFEALPMLAEVIKLKDTSMVSFELSVSQRRHIYDDSVNSCQ